MKKLIVLCIFCLLFLSAVSSQELKIIKDNSIDSEDIEVADYRVNTKTGYEGYENFLTSFMDRSDSERFINYTNPQKSDLYMDRIAGSSYFVLEKNDGGGYSRLDGFNFPSDTRRMIVGNPQCKYTISGDLVQGNNPNPGQGTIVSDEREISTEDTIGFGQLNPSNSDQYVHPNSDGNFELEFRDNCRDSITLNYIDPDYSPTRVAGSKTYQLNKFGEEKNIEFPVGSLRDLSIRNDDLSIRNIANVEGEQASTIQVPVIVGNGKDSRKNVEVEAFLNEDSVHSKRVDIDANSEKTVNMPVTLPDESGTAGLRIKLGKRQRHSRGLYVPTDEENTQIRVNPDFTGAVDAENTEIEELSDSILRISTTLKYQGEYNYRSHVDQSPATVRISTPEDNLESKTVQVPRQYPKTKDVSLEIDMPREEKTYTLEVRSDTVAGKRWEGEDEIVYEPDEETLENREQSEASGGATSETHTDETGEAEIVDSSINYELDGMTVSLSTDAEAAGGLDSVEWDVDEDGDYELEGRSVEREYSSSGQKEVEMKITSGEETETDEIQIQVGSTSEPEISINNSTPRLGDTIEITTQGLEGENLKLERNGEEVDEITLEDSKAEYTLEEELESGEYTLKTTSSVEGGILGELENAISNAILGPSAVKEFTVLDQKEAWISYCNANGDYNIESISEDPVEAENCILDIIVPKWFEGEVPEDTLVAENLCSDLGLAPYNREVKSCTN